jgi:hypothetical protein
LTKDTNLSISDRLPEEYFPEIEARHPGALASQWIPKDPQLWILENYAHFLEARRSLLAIETNRRFEDLLHGDNHWLRGSMSESKTAEVAAGGSASGDDEAELESLNAWLELHHLPPGQVAVDYCDSDTGNIRGVFDLAWPDGLQLGFSQPVAILLHGEGLSFVLADGAHVRCFKSVSDFQAYAVNELLEVAPAR